MKDIQIYYFHTVKDQNSVLCPDCFLFQNEKASEAEFKASLDPKTLR